jgi:hypothetical protein
VRVGRTYLLRGLHEVLLGWACVVIGVLWIANGVLFRRLWKKSTRDMSPKWRWFYLIEAWSGRLRA